MLLLLCCVPSLRYESVHESCSKINAKMFDDDAFLLCPSRQWGTCLVWPADVPPRVLSSQRRQQTRFLHSEYGLPSNVCLRQLTTSPEDKCVPAHTQCVFTPTHLCSHTRFIVKLFSVPSACQRNANTRKDTKFGRAAASSLAALLEAFPECCVYDLVAPTLLDLAGLDGAAAAGTTSGGGKEDPIMQARAVACLAAAWPRVPAPTTSPSAAAPDAAAAAATAGRIDAICNVQRAHAASLTRVLSGAILLKVWSVRVPIYGALSAIVSRTTTAAESRAPVLSGSLLADVVRAVELGAEDAKYSQVCVCVVTNRIDPANRLPDDKTSVIYARWVLCIIFSRLSLGGCCVNLILIIW